MFASRFSSACLNLVYAWFLGVPYFFASKLHKVKNDPIPIPSHLHDKLSEVPSVQGRCL